MVARTRTIAAPEFARTVERPRPSLAAAARRLLALILVHGGCLAAAAVAFAAHEHFKLRGASTESLASLLATAAFGLWPVRALARELLAIEGKLLHLVHGVGGLALLGLTLGGVVSGRGALDRAALAPFAMMAAAQAVMHQGQPRSPEQAAAYRRFVTSLPEAQQLARSSDLQSPANARRAVAVLLDLVEKAQALGETELRSDRGFQSAWRRTLTRFGLSLGLDSVDGALQSLAANPAAASALPELRHRVAAARSTLR